MINKESLCAVITGDLVSSSELGYQRRESVLSYLHSSFGSIAVQLQVDDAVLLPFDIYRGDSFQVVLTCPERALLISVLLSIKLSLFDQEMNDLAARISIGIGTIGHIPDSGNVGEADGVAFRLSGRSLDMMKEKDQGLLVTAPNAALNLMFESQCTFFDLISGRWTDIQKGMIFEKLSGLTQEEIASRHGRSQSTVSQSLRSAGFDTVKKFLANYEGLFNYPGIFVEGDE